MIYIDKVLIYGVKKGSIAEEIGLKKGDLILTLNGEKIVDILDYKFNVADEYLEIEIEHKDGTIEIYEIEKDESEDLGIIFESELIDEPRSCYNKCIFCFMEQLPDNVRETLIFKDDDYRLSFFSGNYITMTNMKDIDVDRIIRYRLSPINISIHATDEKVRCMMLNNRHAGKVLEYLDRFYQAGISINTQIVLCKGINDGNILKKTIVDLSKYAPVLKSICIVPVGLSNNRDGLYPLEALSKEDCENTIDLVSKYQEKFKKKFKTPLVFLADEFYLKAGRKMPNYSDYGEFGQIEDGIGMTALFEHDFKKEIKQLKEKNISYPKSKTISMITGKIVEDYMKKKAKAIQARVGNLNINIIAVENEYFGEQITVTGLITGRDILKTLHGLKEDGINIGEYIVIPRVMLKDDEDIFLDDTKLEDLQKELKLPIVVTDGSAKVFIESTILNVKNKKILKLGDTSPRQSYENGIK
ncbi:MAG: DUF512 domain-containing protein [Clostridia bacterium]|nr:DUF512 domain-containing protein [Clostridia bacterium]